MIELNVTNLVGENITITTGSSAPATHEDTWYKYAGDTEWRTVMLGGTIALVDDMGESTEQIENPYDIVEIEIGTGIQENPVTSIGDYSFYLCIGLTSVTIPDSVTSIGESAFDGCSSLTNVAIPNGVTSIVAGTFQNCEGLASVTIGSEIQGIGVNAFATSGSPVTLTIGKTVAEVQAMGTTDYDSSTNVPYSSWGLPHGSTIVCTNGTIPIRPEAE